jgi:predicted RNA-binding Zn ribbon-like protein
VNDESPVELLLDTASRSRWFNAVGLLKGAGKDQAAQTWPKSQMGRRFLEDLLLFREKLRSTVLRLESGKNPEPAFLQELNKRLLAYPRRYVLVSNRSGTRRQTYLDAAANPNDHDISKKGSRRWCSMHLCGNREKVSTYRRKQRAQES